KSMHIDTTRETKDSLSVIGTEEFDARVGHKLFVCASVVSGTQYMVSLHFLGRVILLTNPQPEKISVGLNVRPTIKWPWVDAASTTLHMWSSYTLHRHLTFLMKSPPISRWGEINILALAAIDG